MAIVFPQGFDIASKEPVDSRLVMTKAQMLTKLKGDMPDNYLCVCSDDGKLYLWNSAFDKNPEYGRFKPYEEIIDLPKVIDEAVEKEPERLAESAAGILPAALQKALERQTESSGLIVDENGNIKVNLDQENIVFDDQNRVSLNIDIVQAI